MKLSSLHNNHERLVAAIESTIPGSRAVGVNDLVNIAVPPMDYDKAIFLVKKYGWQVHNQGNGQISGRIVFDVTPIHGSEYKHRQATVYHVTDKANVPEILNSGLQLRSMTDGMRYPRRVYVYPTYKSAYSHYYAAWKLGRMFNRGMDPVLLKIDNSGGKYKLFIDPEYGYSGDEFGGEDVPTFTKRVIDPSDISVVEIDRETAKHPYDASSNR